MIAISRRAAAVEGGSYRTEPAVVARPNRSPSLSKGSLSLPKGRFVP